MLKDFRVLEKNRSDKLPVSRLRRRLRPQRSSRAIRFARRANKSRKMEYLGRSVAVVISASANRGGAAGRKQFERRDVAALRINMRDLNERAGRAEGI